MNGKEPVDYRIGDKDVVSMFLGTEEIWTIEPAAGSVMLDVAGDYDWIVPRGVKLVTVCMIGGGGNGTQGQTNVNGGSAGEIFTGNVAVHGSQVIKIKVGTQQHLSSFGSIVVQGGEHGVYNGRRGTKTNCAGTFKDGGEVSAASHTRYFRGGEAGFHDGGMGKGSGGAPAFFGAGAGGCSYGSSSATGGHGVVIISWKGRVPTNLITNLHSAVGSGGWTIVGNTSITMIAHHLGEDNVIRFGGPHSATAGAVELIINVPIGVPLTFEYDFDAGTYKTSRNLDVVEGSYSNPGNKLVDSITYGPNLGWQTAKVNFTSQTGQISIYFRRTWDVKLTIGRMILHKT